LYDTPILGTGNNSQQIFESTALAIEGTKRIPITGPYSGVGKEMVPGIFQWIDFKALSQAAPTANFPYCREHLEWCY